MTKEDIIRMAREAGVKTSLFVLDGKDSGYFCLFERFAAIVAAAEREECARLCEEPYDLIQITDDCSEYVYKDHLVCADAIRARGQG
jgi:hypothetical protein